MPSHTISYTYLQEVEYLPILVASHFVEFLAEDMSERHCRRLE